MAERKFYVDINLLQNELKNGVIHKVADVGSLPTGIEGQFAYVGGTVKLVYVHDGTDWKPIGDIPQFTGDVINSGLDMQIQPGVVGTPELGDGAVTTPKIGDGQVTNPKLADMPANTVKANITAGAASPQDVTYSELVAKLAVRADLALGTVGIDTVTVDIQTETVDGDSVILPGATNTAAGVMTKAQVIALEALGAAVTTHTIVMSSTDATSAVNGVTALIKLAETGGSGNAGLMTSAEKGLVGTALQDITLTLNQDGVKARIGADESTNTIDILEVTATRAGLMTPAMLADLEAAEDQVLAIGWIQTSGTKNETTLTVDGVLQKVDVPIATTVLAGLMSSADKGILNNLSPLQPTFVDNVGKVVFTELSLTNGGTLSGIDWISDSDIFGNSDGSEDSAIYSELVPTKAGVRKYVLNVLEGIGEFRGSYDAANDIGTDGGSTGGLDGFNSTQITDIVKGDYWIVDTPGDFFDVTTENGKAVASGDRIIANEDYADMVSIPSIGNYTVVKPSFSNATEELHGLVELATEAEALTGTLHESAAITPKTLKYVLDNGPASQKKSAEFGDGTTTVFDFSHTFGWGVTVQVFDDSQIQIEAQVTITETNVNLEFNSAPASGFRYVIVG